MLYASMLVFACLAALGICFLAGGFESLAWLWILPAGFAGGFLAALLLAFLFLYRLVSRVDTSVPQEHDDPFYRKVTYRYAEAILPLLRMKVHTRGLEQTPKEGRFLLVCNHLFELDPVVLYAYFQQSQLAFISKRENNDMFIIGKLMHRLMAQLINRENDREALKTILKCVQLIQEDEVSIAVFPEGYISKNHHLLHFRSGALKIATKAKVPIVVCTIQGTDKVLGNIKRLRSTPIELHLLDVITPEEMRGRTTTDIGEQIYRMMAADLGPDYAPLDAENP
mgnify:FL=1